MSKEKAEVVEPKKAVVDAEVAKAEEAAAAANAIKTECEDALAVALPVLDSALCALAWRVLPVPALAFSFFIFPRGLVNVSRALGSVLILTLPLT